jgi:integrase
MARRPANGADPRKFGTIRLLASGRYQARYLHPTETKIVNGKRRKRQVSAPETFLRKGDAAAWLTRQQIAIEDGKWRPPTAGMQQRFTEVAEAWLAEHAVLKPRTRGHYRWLLDRYLLPEFGDLALTQITQQSVRSWHKRIGALRGRGGLAPLTAQAHAYGLLKSILRQAVADELLASNPCQLGRRDGAGQVDRVSKTTIADDAEVEAIAAAMQPRLAMMVQLAAWTMLRFGELAELRRSDVEIDEQGFEVEVDGKIEMHHIDVLHVRRAVVAVKREPGSESGRIVGKPKSKAGIRDAYVPPHLHDQLVAHLDEHCQPGPHGLLFPSAGGGSHLATRTLYDSYYPAREAAGRPDLRFHDLRHTGATWLAQNDATLKELMVAGGWSTPGVAMRYQHATEERRRELAERMSSMHSNVIPIGRRGRKRAS